MLAAGIALLPLFGLYFCVAVGCNPGQRQTLGGAASSQPYGSVGAAEGLRFVIEKLRGLSVAFDFRQVADIVRGERRTGDAIEFDHRLIQRRLRLKLTPAIVGDVELTLEHEKRRRISHRETTLLGKQYADKYFPPTAKQTAIANFDQIIGALKDDLSTLDWMSDGTRQLAADIAGAQLRVCAGAGHFLAYDRYTQIFTDLLAQGSPVGGT